MNLPLRGAEPVSAAVGVPSRNAALQAIWVLWVPTRRNADVGHTEETLDRGPFAEVVALGTMADPLKEIAHYQGGDAPVPWDHPYPSQYAGHTASRITKPATAIGMPIR